MRMVNGLSARAPSCLTIQPCKLRLDAWYGMVWYGMVVDLLLDRLIDSMGGLVSSCLIVQVPGHRCPHILFCTYPFSPFLGPPPKAELSLYCRYRAVDRSVSLHDWGRGWNLVDD